MKKVQLKCRLHLIKARQKYRGGAAFIHRFRWWNSFLTSEFLLYNSSNSSTVTMCQTEILPLWIFSEASASHSASFWTNFYCIFLLSSSLYLRFPLCVSVPVGFSAMLNAPFSSLPRQELICEIIYLPVYFKHWGDALLITPTHFTLAANGLSEQAFHCMFCFHVCMSQAGLNLTVLTLIWLNSINPLHISCMTEVASSITVHKADKRENRGNPQSGRWKRVNGFISVDRKAVSYPFAPVILTFPHAHTTSTPLGTQRIPSWGVWSPHLSIRGGLRCSGWCQSKRGASTVLRACGLSSFPLFMLSLNAEI